MALGQLKPWLQRGQASYLRGDYPSSAGMAQYLLSNLAGKNPFYGLQGSAYESSSLIWC
ncbi:hypothetical protein BN439_3313 [Erwinia amylovora Ea644]|nr:hypothetical protein BN439_3313 [Erwinia amylovora Ea644]CCP08412.1 hypothetical protein BN440_3415 [Erwinia amylovora MR1]